MIRLLLVSDTHGYLGYLEKILQKVGPVDQILHMGDVCGQQEDIRRMVSCPVTFVRGNCDGRESQDPVDRVLDLEGHRILMTHGHTHGVNWDHSGLSMDAKACGADLAIYGHTHVPCVKYEEGLMIINPGSASLPRQSGFRKSFAILELKEGQFPCYCSIGYL